MEDIMGAIESKKSVLSSMLIETAYDFIPAFVTSDDFMSYFDSHHAAMKAHNKALHVDSKVANTISLIVLVGDKYSSIRRGWGGFRRPWRT